MDNGRMNNYLKALKRHLEEMEARMKEYLADQCGDLERRHALSGRTLELRTRQALGDVAMLSERLLAVEDRISELERRRSI